MDLLAAHFPGLLQQPYVTPVKIFSLVFIRTVIHMKAHARLAIYYLTNWMQIPITFNANFYSASRNVCLFRILEK